MENRQAEVLVPDPTEAALNLVVCLLVAALGIAVAVLGTPSGTYFAIGLLTTFVALLTALRLRSTTVRRDGANVTYRGLLRTKSWPALDTESVQHTPRGTYVKVRGQQDAFRLTTFSSRASAEAVRDFLTPAHP